MGDHRFVKRQNSITNNEIEEIFDERKSLLYSNDEPWIKKGESNFYFTMCPYDAAEVCELIGILCCHFLINTLARVLLGCIGMTASLF